MGPVAQTGTPAQARVAGSSPVQGKSLKIISCQRAAEGEDDKPTSSPWPLIKRCPRLAAHLLSVGLGLCARNWAVDDTIRGSTQLIFMFLASGTKPGSGRAPASQHWLSE